MFLSIDTSISKSSQLDFAIPQSKIARLSLGEFVGMVSDNPTDKVKLKTFHREIINDHELLKAEVGRYKDLPIISPVTIQIVNDNFKRIKTEIVTIIETKVEPILNTPGLQNISK